MNIGFDLDKIFVDYPPIVPPWVIDRLYKEKSNGILKYRIPGSLEQKIRQFSHFPLLRPLIKKNLKFLQTLSAQHKNNLFLISSRFGFLQKQTQNLVKKAKFDRLFTGLYFNFHNIQPHLFKEKVIRQLAIDRYVDDDFALLKYLAKRNPKTLFFWLNSGNRGKITNNLFGITSIEEVVK